MKVLVINLLRIGDVLQTAPVLAGLKRRTPGDEIHLLINTQCAGVKNIMTGVDKFHFFDRERIQSGLGESNRAVFESFDRCGEFVETLRAEKFDQVINLTHNRLSAWLVSLIGAPESSGLSVAADGSVLFGGAWFRYLNSQMSSNGADPFHYVDLLYYAAGLRETKHPIELAETKEGSLAATKALEGLADFIAIQPLTSDPKKNWPLSGFTEVIKTLNALHPSLGYVILGSPAEAPRLDQFVADLKHRGLRVRPAYENLETTFSILKRSRLVLTGDTSIKHLASSAATQIVELSLGSSDHKKTGAYRTGSVIIQAREHCAPCPHSAPCSRDHHACAEKIEPELVSLAVSKCLSGHIHELRLLAREFKNKTEIFRTAISESGYWTYHSLLPGEGERSVARLLDLSSWRLHLSPDPTAAVGEFGTEGLRVRRSLKAAFPETSTEDWLDQINTLENELERLEARLGVFLIDFKAFLKSYDRKELFEKFCTRVGGYFEKNIERVTSSYQREILGTLSDISGGTIGDFTKVRKMNDAIIQAHQRVEIELRLLKSFKSNVMESV